MPAGYRTALISIGVFLALGGAVGLIAGLVTHSTGPEHVNSFLGSGFATLCGIVIVQSALAGRVPRWVARLFGYKQEED